MFKNTQSNQKWFKKVVNYQQFLDYIFWTIFWTFLKSTRRQFMKNLYHMHPPQCWIWRLCEIILCNISSLTERLCLNRYILNGKYLPYFSFFLKMSNPSWNMHAFHDSFYFVYRTCATIVRSQNISCNPQKYANFCFLCHFWAKVSSKKWKKKQI